MSLTLSPSERTLRARAAAHAMHAQGKTNTGPATVAQLARFERQVDPDGTLAPDERAKRADHALKAHMASLSLKASRARTKNSMKKAPAVTEIPAGAELEDVRHDADPAA